MGFHVTIQQHASKPTNFFYLKIMVKKNCHPLASMNEIDFKNITSIILLNIKKK